MDYNSRELLFCFFFLFFFSIFNFLNFNLILVNLHVDEARFPVVAVFL